MDSPNETQALRDEIALLREQLREAKSIIKTSELMRDEVRILELRAQAKRRADDYRLPNGTYETLEDVGILEGVRVAMQRLWHKDCPDFRKALLHATKLQYDLRESLKRIL